MKKPLQIGLLGPVKIEIAHQSITNDLPLKGQAILSYLAMRQRPLSRQLLATLFWGHMEDEDARRNLRGVIMKLRQAVGDYLQIDNQQVGLLLDEQVAVDLHTFEASRQEGTVSALETAVSLYRGEFMADFYVRDAEQFESWQEQERTRIHQLILQAHDQLLTRYEATQQIEAGIQLARRLLDIEPTREASHRYLIRFLVYNDWTDAALDQFEAMRSLLDKELQVDVSAESWQLLNEIRQGTVPTSAAVAPVAEHLLPPPAQNPFIAGPPVTEPAHFFGREMIIKRLFRLFQKRPFQNAAIIGPRRSGKTSLLHYLKTIHTAAPAQRRPEQTTNWLPHPEQYRWVFVDFQDARLGELSRLLNHMLRQMELPTPTNCTLDEFLDIVADELRHPTVILMDEIGVALSRYPALDDAFWESLRSLATNQVEGKMGFVLSSHEMPSELAQHNGYGSPFFNIFGYTAVLGPLKENEARALINSAPLPFPADDVAWILQTSGGWPMPLQILCRERLLTLEEGEAGEEWREDALRQAHPFLPKSFV